MSDNILPPPITLVFRPPTVTVTWRNVHGIHVLAMGDIDIGRVARTGGKGDKPRWLFNLANPCCQWRTARTLDAACESLRVELRKWLASAGLPHDLIEASEVPA